MIDLLAVLLAVNISFIFAIPLLAASDGRPDHMN